MKLKDLNINEALNNAKRAIQEDKGISSSTKAVIELLMLLITLFMQKLNLDSSNSSIPPSADPNRLNRGKTKPYSFDLLPDTKQQNILEPNKLYLAVEQGHIVYQCLDPNGEIVQGTITQNDLPKGTEIPSSNDLKSLNALRKPILKVTQERGDTAPLKKPGGQPGRVGVTLKPFDEPDEIIELHLEPKSLPKNLKKRGYVARQVVDIKISRHITEYRSYALEDSQGNQYTPEFPPGVGRDVQYGPTIKSRVVFSSVYQLIPYQRLCEQFAEDYKLPVSVGSVSNFIKEAASLLRKQQFDRRVKDALLKSPLIHADETSININGHKVWLHTAANEQWSWLEPHPIRGTEAMIKIGVLENFKGVLCHDHWMSYFTFNNCTHALCNAHLLRELTWSFEQDGQKWAKRMHCFLLEQKREIENCETQCLSEEYYKKCCKDYRTIVDQGELECPEALPKPGTKRKPKQTKSRNLLTRFRDYQNCVLLFAKQSFVPFTNNLGERDIRMSKVRQKISGCFKNLERAKDFFIVRSYIQTCKKNDVSSTLALERLFHEKLPDFLNTS